MDPNDRLNLQRMVKANDVDETTDLIRNVKHSSQIRKSVDKLIELRKNNPDLAKDNSEESVLRL